MTFSIFNDKQNLNLELELEIYPKEPILTDIIKNGIKSKYIYSNMISISLKYTCVFLRIINFFLNCSDLVYDRSRHKNNRLNYLLVKK